MKIRTTLAALGLAAIVGSAASAALDGDYTSADNSMTIGFSADGAHTVTIPAASITIAMTYTVDGDTVTIVPGADDMFCMGASGSYTIAEDGDTVTFTAIDDPCEQRKTSMESRAWTKKAE